MDMSTSIGMGIGLGMSESRAPCREWTGTGMQVRFWGVRGVAPSDAPEIAHVGGHTCCVEVTCGATRIVLDAGTGIRLLGTRLADGDDLRLHLLLSHYHSDHVQGLSDFAPLRHRNAELEIFGAPTDGAGRASSGTNAASLLAPLPEPLPIAERSVAARCTFHPIADGDRLHLGDAEIRVVELDHPDGVLAFRIDHSGASVVYATDTMQWPEPDPSLLDLACDADLLVFDAQYTPGEFAELLCDPSRNRGHSTFEMGCTIARAAHVDRLFLFHHDPGRSDRDMARLEWRARQVFPGVYVAKEGREIRLGDSARAY